MPLFCCSLEVYVMDCKFMRELRGTKKNVLTCHGGCKGRLRQSFHLDIVYQHSWPGLELA